VEVSQTSPFQRACLLAAQAPQSSIWLLSLPMTACSLRLKDEAVRIAVALRLGSELGSPHICRSGSLVDSTGTHGLVCKQAASRVVRHHALNDCISRAFGAGKETSRSGSKMGSALMAPTGFNPAAIAMHDTAPLRK